jgi:hypothetical protein
MRGTHGKELMALANSSHVNLEAGLQWSPEVTTAMTKPWLQFWERL